MKDMYFLPIVTIILLARILALSNSNKAACVFIASPSLELTSDYTSGSQTGVNYPTGIICDSLGDNAEPKPLCCSIV